MMEQNYMVFGSVDSRDYNVVIFDLDTDRSPESTDDGILIPGKNGRLLLQNHNYDNVDHRYMGVIYDSADIMFPAFRDAILGETGYQRLEDSIHEDEFYLAKYIGGLEAELTPERKMVKFPIEFSRKPQRFLISGEKEVEITSGQKLINPAKQTANPLIKVTGYGALVVGGETITISSYNRSYLLIDSEMKDCYYDAYNLNSYVDFSSDEFPTLGKGSTTINYSGNITAVTVVPRWWRA